MDTTETNVESPRRGLPSRRVMAVALLRSLATAVVLFWLYYLFPVSTDVDLLAAGVLLVGLLVFVVLITWQVRVIIRANYPALRAVESLAAALPLFLIIFATVYVILDSATTGAFSEPMTKTDSLYFTITVFATVGFGDITPKTELTRIIVTIQMVADLLVLGIIVRLMLSAVKEGVQRRETERGPAPRS